MPASFRATVTGSGLGGAGRRRGAARALAGWAVAAGVALAAPAGAPAQEGGGALVSPGQAPFGELVAERRIPAYDRATPRIGTAGPLDQDGVAEAKRVGFRTIVDLTPSADESERERNIAEFAGLGYVNVPVADDVPSEEQVEEFARVVEDPDNLPVLLHGRDLDQVGAMWALYRARIGVPPEIALLDGLTAGLGERADAVRERLGLAAGGGG